MALTRKEKILQALLNDEADKCGGGLTREERMLSKLAKTSCDNDVLQGGGGSGGGATTWEDLGLKKEASDVVVLAETKIIKSQRLEETLIFRGDVPYRVIFDGTDYELLSAWGSTGATLGDANLETYPFYINGDVTEIYTVIRVVDDGKEHSIEVHNIEPAVTVVPIPERFIPDSIARSPLVVTFSTSDMSTATVDKVFYEIQTAIESGQHVITRLSAFGAYLYMNLVTFAKNEQISFVTVQIDVSQKCVSFIQLIIARDNTVTMSRVNSEFTG